MIFDKILYWKNRNNTVTVKDKDGKDVEQRRPIRGQGVVPKPKRVEKDSGVSIGFDNEGHMVAKNRAFRRRRVSLSLKTSQLRKKGKRKK